MQVDCHVSMLTTLALCLSSCGGNELAISQAETACELCRSSETMDEVLQCEALSALTLVQLGLEQFEEASHTMDELVPLAISLNRHPVLVDMCIPYAIHSVHTGHWLTKEKGKTLLACYLKCGSKGWRGPANNILSLLANQKMETGLHEEAAELLAEYFSHEAEGRFSPRSKMLLEMYCSCLSELDDWDKCYSILDPIVDVFKDVSTDLDISLAVLHAQAISHRGELPEAIQLCEEYLKQIPKPTKGNSKDYDQFVGLHTLLWQTLIKFQFVAKDHDAAKNSLEKGSAFIVDHMGRLHQYNIWFLDQQGELAMRQQRYLDAKYFFTDLAKIYEESEESEHSFYKKACEKRDRAERLASSELNSK